MSVMLYSVLHARRRLSTEMTIMKDDVRGNCITHTHKTVASGVFIVRHREFAHELH
jgi:hypothetical protein